MVNRCYYVLPTTCSSNTCTIHINAANNRLHRNVPIASSPPNHRTTVLSSNSTPLRCIRRNHCCHTSGYPFLIPTTTPITTLKNWHWPPLCGIPLSSLLRHMLWGTPRSLPLLSLHLCISNVCLSALADAVIALSPAGLTYHTYALPSLQSSFDLGLRHGSVLCLLHPTLLWYGTLPILRLDLHRRYRLFWPLF